MNDDFRPLRKPRKTYNLELRYDSHLMTKFHWDLWTYNGFRLCVILLNVRIVIQYVKENYS